MKKLIVVGVVVVLAVVGWRIGSRLSSDALSMGLGVFFGVMAGVPTALLVLASGRRREQGSAVGDGPGVRQLPGGYAPYPQPPVIVLAGHAGPQFAPPYGQGQPYPENRRALLPGPTTIDAPRRFKVVGEREEWIDEW